MLKNYNSKILKHYNLGQQERLAGKCKSFFKASYESLMTWVQLQNSCKGGKRESTLQSCSLASMQVLWHMHVDIHIIYIHSHNNNQSNI